jgi:hypothetical protein
MRAIRNIGVAAHDLRQRHAVLRQDSRDIRKTRVGLGFTISGHDMVSGDAELA